MQRDTVIAKMDELVYAKTKPFCYTCYREAEVIDDYARCLKCGSDDLMRLWPGYGCEYGTETFYRPLLDALDSQRAEADLSDDWWEEIETSAYGQITIAGITWDTGHVLRELDPIAFQCGKLDYIASLEEDGEVIEVGDQHYWVSQLEDVLDEALEEANTPAEA